MEDIKATRTKLIVSALCVLALFGGWATFADALPIGNFGLKITASYIFPYILVAFWLYSWQRFYVLSRHTNKPIIDALILEKITTPDLIFKLFPPRSYGLANAIAIGKWGWPDSRIPSNAKQNFVFYGRKTLSRCFMFNYLGNDFNGDALYVHFGEPASNIKNGHLTPNCASYWKCLWYEIRFLTTKFFDTPIVGFHYFPHLLSWFTLLCLCISQFISLIHRIF